MIPLHILANITTSAHTPNRPGDTIIERSLRADLRLLLAERVIPDWLATWWLSDETGRSSRYLAACLSGAPILIQTTPPFAPHDTSDVGRCVHLLDLAAANGAPWRVLLATSTPALPNVTWSTDGHHAAWSALLPRWAEIEDAYRADLAAQNAWRKRLPARRAQLHAQPMPPSRCWWLVSTLCGHSDPYAHATPHPFNPEPREPAP